MKYHFCVYIDKKQRIDIYLSSIYTEFSRSYIQKIIDNWEVFVNWKVINKNIKIKNKDEINVELEIKKLQICPENIPIDIVFQNKDFAIINKDPWINTHPTPWIDWNSWTLVNALLYHIKDLSWIWWVERPWIVHRLDKDTSWLIIVAKNDQSMIKIQELFKSRKNISKYYIAVVKWVIKEKEFVIESYIWRHKVDRTRMTTKNPLNPKLAISYVEVLWYIDDKYTLVKVKIETWRTHQIRVHLSSIWHPILWDKVYWDLKVNKEVEKKYWIQRQALHSYMLNFELDKQKFNFVWELKKDLKKIIWDMI